MLNGYHSKSLRSDFNFRLFEYQLVPCSFKAMKRGQHPHRRPRDSSSTVERDIANVEAERAALSYRTTFTDSWCNRSTTGFYPASLGAAPSGSTTFHALAEKLRRRAATSFTSMQFRYACPFWAHSDNSSTSHLQCEGPGAAPGGSTIFASLMFNG